MLQSGDCSISCRGCSEGLRCNPSVNKIIVVVDSDNRNCAEFLAELKSAARRCGSGDKTLIRLAIEEIEAWYFGDSMAIKTAYPNAKVAVLNTYAQDSICGTWEILADAVVAGGSKAIKKNGWAAVGQVKHEWAAKIGRHMNLEANSSPSFKKFRDGVRALANAGV